LNASDDSTLLPSASLYLVHKEDKSKKAGGDVMASNSTPAPHDSAVLVLAEAICDAQLILAECFEQDLPDAPRTLYKLRAILEDKAVIEALKAIGYLQD
jgi:hypothetical protein